MFAGTYRISAARVNASVRCRLFTLCSLNSEPQRLHVAIESGANAGVRCTRPQTGHATSSSMDPAPGQACLRAQSVHQPLGLTLPSTNLQLEGGMKLAQLTHI